MKQVGRLAMRVEGDNWVAYYALPDTMDGALWLGSIKMSIAQEPRRKEAFMDLMRDAVAAFLHEGTGAEVAWPDGPKPAPEHERSGSA